MAPQRHFLLVDDDDLLRGGLADRLTDMLDCRVTQVGTVAEGLAAVAEGPRCDAVILDVLLPDGDGRDMCVRLRALGVRVPIVILTSAGREADVVRGLDAGANDYVVKPFRLAEFMARLRAQLRAFEVSEHAEIAIGCYIFRPGQKTLQASGRGRPIKLTEKEAAVLKYLYRSEGRPVTRETLLHEVWGYSASASTHTVETHIYRLRRKIEPHPDSERLLVSEAGGYRLRLGGAGPTLRWPGRAPDALELMRA
jgi:DNA-binding response OmpR family regulator